VIKAKFAGTATCDHCGPAGGSVDKPPLKALHFQPPCGRAADDLFRDFLSRANALQLTACCRSWCGPRAARGN